MGYRVQRIPDGKAWRLLMETYPDGRTKTQHVKIENWPPGFKKELTFDQAKALAKEYNSKDRILKQQIRIHAIEERLDREDLVECAYLPQELVAEFENKVLVNKFGRITTRENPAPGARPNGSSARSRWIRPIGFFSPNRSTAISKSMRSASTIASGFSK